MYMKNFAVFSLLLALLFVGCSDKHGDNGTPKLDQKAAQKLQPVSMPASLRAVMPKAAIGYIRIPNPWGLLSAPKGDVLNAALGNAQNIETIDKLRTALRDNVLKKLKPPADLIYSILLYHLRSPVEILLLRPDEAGPPLPDVLVSAKLDLRTAQEVNGLLARAAADVPQLSVLRKVSANGYGLLQAGAMQVYLDFDAETRNLRIMAGPQLSDSIFRKTLQSLQPVADHPMYALENQIDSSHQGFFEWIDVQGMLSVMRATMSPQKLLELQRAGLTRVKQLALGWGTSDGKGRLKFVAEVPGAGFDRYFTTAPGDIELAAAGVPRTVVSVALPGSRQLTNIEDFIRLHAPPKEYFNYQLAKARFRQALGVSYEDVLDAIGPEMLFFSDEVGEFAAVKVRDKQRWRKVLDVWSNMPGNRYESRSIGGHTYHQLVIPSIWAGATQGPQAKKLPALFRLLREGSSHLYWIEDDGYLIFAKVPQLLRDREAYRERERIGKWLQRRQRQDVGSSVLMLSTTISHSPRRLYYGYLQLLNYLGDIAHERVDLFALPSARELKLPSKGTYGIQLDISKSSLALELTFENNPLEFLIGQKLAGVATVGILATIAIPAYDEYTVRAKVAEGMQLAVPLRAAITKFHRKYGLFPSERDLDKAALSIHGGKNVESIRITPDTGVITIRYKGDRRLAGKSITLTPVLQGDRLVWSCSGNMGRKYRPAFCR